jgi:SAM-dependent methyltransferase
MVQKVEVGREKPSNYGRWWDENQLDETWYKSIFDVRPRAHQYFLDWFSELIRRGERIGSILEVGCGRGQPYAKLFEGYDYYGADISEKEIAHCQWSYENGPSRFFVADAIQDDLRGPYDLVFCHAVVDHVYDINLFLQKLARASTSRLYVSSYRDWSPRLQTHEYVWYEPCTSYLNRLSPDETRRALSEVGCAEVEVFPLFVGNQADNLPWETIATATGGARR